jgi:hypothetical protein
MPIGDWKAKMVPSTFLSTLVSLIILIAIPGCVMRVDGENNTTHHVVIGFGMVSTNEAPRNAVVTTDVTALGITLSDRPGLKFGIGYTASTIVTVAPGASDVRVEVSKPFGGPLTVNTPSAEMEEEEDDGPRVR